MVIGGNKMKNKIFVMALLALLVLPIMVSAQSSPIVRLSISNYDPFPVQPGEFVDVWVVVQNIGAGEAKNIRIEHIESPFFQLVNPSDKVQEIPVLGAYRDYVLRYRFKVANNVVEGTNELTFEHTMGGFPGVVSTSNLRLDIKSTEVPIAISSVRLNPDPVEPGQRADLTLAVKNLALSSNLRDVSVTLQLISTTPTGIVELPFAPVDSTNKKSVGRILPGQTTEFKFSLVTYPTADSKIYKVPVLISYFDDLGRRYDDTTFISINVNSEPDLHVIIEAISVDTRVRNGEVMFDIINKGISDVKLLSVHLDDSDSLEVTSASRVEYLGNVDSDDFKTARFKIAVKNGVEVVTFPITLTFRDALNNEFKETYEISYKLRAPTGNGGSFSTWIIILVIIGGIVGFYYYRKNKKKKSSKDDD